jgi:beta-mannosidase
VRDALMRIQVDGWDPGCVAFGDDCDASFTTAFEAPVDGHLRFDGIATLASVKIDGSIVARSSSMWVPLQVPLAAGSHCIEVHCRALAPELSTPRKPRARWRQTIAADKNLRWFRTTLIGRTPGLAPGPPVVGLWRPVWFVANEPQLKARTRMEGADGLVTITSNLPDGVRIRVGDACETLVGGKAELMIHSPKLWWPHTHGEPYLYDVTADDHQLMRKVGFRTIESPGDVLRDGLRPRINGIDLFVRGAVWTPVPEGQERSTLETAREHGLNAVRIAGTMTYESAEFHDLCDELGMLVWQDLMFANFDYPFADPEFRALVDEEVRALIDVIGGRPSTFCVCGGSEIEQQAAMLGLNPSLARPPFLGEELPALLKDAEVDALYVPSAPCGADRPMLASQGVSNWFGVGAYLRPFAEIRSARVSFASECLALANIGDQAPDPSDPSWKDGVPRDLGADWDFEDVRDHYLNLLYAVDPEKLKATDPDRWLALSRRVSGDVMGEVLGEWRRPDSRCSGAFILWLRDLSAGTGWGLIDSSGAPKPVLRALRVLLAPVAVWMTDEGMSGYGVHVANDGPAPLEATVRISLSREGRPIDGGERSLRLPPHGAWSGDVETIIGRWVDASYAYRFGSPAHDLVTAELRSESNELLSQACRFPLGRARAA